MKPTQRLKKETVRLLRRVQRHILKEPRRLAMGVWANASASVYCGTVGCIAGWAVMLTRPSLQRAVRDRVDKVYDWESVGRKALRISPERARSLFHNENWPTDYRNRLEETHLQKEYVDVTIERIEHFIQTGE